MTIYSYLLFNYHRDMEIVQKKTQFDCCVSRFSNSEWSMLFNVCMSMPKAWATLSMSKPKDLSSSMKSISSPVKGLWSLGQEWLHCGQEHLSKRLWVHLRPFGFFWERKTDLDGLLSALLRLFDVIGTVLL